MPQQLERLTGTLADRYRVEGELGQGGMATVYLAEDLRHKRRVALKVLKPELAAVLGAERFVQEITTTAALQHPHILPLFDSGTADGLLYYVMPYIEGETLRTKLNRETQLGIEEALRITTEVADALDYAHRHGVIHRDIKPENILLHDGRPMVADFGIALAVSAAAGGRMTETGLSLGTPHYMSPEQATAEKEITARSDIYSLAAVLYEMLSGNPPHTGASAQQIIMKIVTEDAADITRLRKSVPSHVAAALAKALEKLPADRFARASDFSAALGNTTYAATTHSGRRTVQVRGGAAVAGRPRRTAALAAAVGLACTGLGLAAGWLLWRPKPPARPPIVSRHAMLLPDSAALIADATGTVVAIARDGSAFAYVSGLGLMLRFADRLEFVPVAGGRRAVVPFFSPDGQWLGYQTGSALVKVPLAGGTPIRICDSCTGYTFDWGTDDTVRYYTAPPGEPQARVLMAVSARGGRPYELARPDSGSGEQFRSPILLPGRRTVLFAVFNGRVSRLAALDLRTGAITRFDQPGFSPQWVETGFVVLGNPDGTLNALPFDADRVRPTGPPVIITREVGQLDPYLSRAAVSASGSIVYVQLGKSSPRQLMLVSRTGQTTPLAVAPRAVANPRFSPDGRRVAVDIADPAGGGRDVWVLDVAQRTWSRLTTDGISGRPVWTPDGRRLVYSSNADLWWIAADGSGRPESLLVTDGSRFAGTVTPDGRAVVFQEASSSNDGIRLLAFDSAPAARTIMAAAFGESAPDLSPDGRWLAYQSDETGQMEVYVRPLQESGARVPVSHGGGTEPAWARSGRELFYRSGDSVWVASVAASPAFMLTARRFLFAGSFLRGGVFREYDVTPDDSRLLMISGGAAQSTLIGLQGVFDRLLYDQKQTQR
ncbi:MAG TPA: protein kinase [Gemmatimonadales bacterium]|nr:protein kinase [Gemmatimonadales bacterium]